MADDRGPEPANLVPRPPAKAKVRPGLARRVVLRAVLILGGAVGGSLADSALRSHSLKDLPSWLSLDRWPVVVFLAGAGCLGVAGAIVITVFAALLWRFGNKVLEKTSTYGEALESYTRTSQALQTIIRPPKIDPPANETNHSGLKDDSSATEAQILQMPD
jgi:hypothetical protein